MSDENSPSKSNAARERMNALLMGRHGPLPISAPDEDLPREDVELAALGVDPFGEEALAQVRKELSARLGISEAELIKQEPLLE